MERFQWFTTDMNMKKQTSVYFNYGSKATKNKNILKKTKTVKQNRTRQKHL